MVYQYIDDHVNENHFANKNIIYILTLLMGIVIINALLFRQIML